MNKRNIIGSTVLIVGLLAAGTSFADEASTTAPAPKLPGDQGLASVNKNLDKNPDNKGLQNAAAQLEKNRIKHEEQAEKRSEKREQHMEKRTERAERHDSAANRPAKVDRPGK